MADMVTLETYREMESRKEKRIADIKANCDLAIEGRDVKIMELEQKLEQTEKDLADYQFNYPSIKELEKKNAELNDKLNNWVKCAELRLANWLKYEKVTNLLGERCNQLLKDKGELTDKVRELEEQNSHLYNDLTCTSAEFAKKSKMLEQAKKIIKMLADDLSVYSGNYQKELLEAEQFLKE